MYVTDWWKKVKMLVYEITAVVIGVLLVLVTWLLLGLFEMLPAPIDIQRPEAEQEPYRERYPAEINHR